MATAAPAIRPSLPLLGALLLPLPWLVLASRDAHVSPLLVVALAGAAILGAAFLLSWAAELLQMDISQAFALALLALIAVLPEYAADAVFAYQAGQDPAVAQEGYAVANMTGANRLLIGLGWSSVVLVAWWRRGSREVVLERAQALELSMLLVASARLGDVPSRLRAGVAHAVEVASRALAEPPSAETPTPDAAVALPNRRPAIAWK